MNTWAAQSGQPSLSESDVHVWRVDLDQPLERVQQYWGNLSKDERTRADKFLAHRDRIRFIVGRGVLRELLSNYMQLGAKNLTFEFGLYGKPVLSKAQNPDLIQFNLSHTNDIAVFAFTIRREVGIDIEFVHSIRDMAQIASRYFSIREYEMWDGLPETEKEQAFFLCWTRKEAFIKAIGNGLYYPLDKFAVTLSPGDSPRLTWIDGNNQQVAHWSYAELPSLPGYATALIAGGNDWQLYCFEYQSQYIDGLT